MKTTVIDYELIPSMFQNVKQYPFMHDILTDKTHRFPREIVRLILEYALFLFSLNAKQTLKMTFPKIQNVTLNRKKDEKQFYVVVRNAKPYMMTFETDRHSLQPISTEIASKDFMGRADFTPLMKGDKYWAQSNIFSFLVYQPNDEGVIEEVICNRHGLIKTLEFTTGDRIFIADGEKIGYYSPPTFDRFIPICPDNSFGDIHQIRVREDSTILTVGEKGVALWDFNQKTPLDAIPTDINTTFVNRSCDTIAVYFRSGNRIETKAVQAFRIIDNKFTILSHYVGKDLPFVPMYGFYDSTDDICVYSYYYKKTTLSFVAIENPAIILAESVLEIDSNIGGLIITDNTVIFWAGNTVYQTIF